MTFIVLNFKYSHMSEYLFFYVTYEVTSIFQWQISVESASKQVS